TRRRSYTPSTLTHPTSHPRPLHAALPICIELRGGHRIRHQHIGEQRVTLIELVLDRQDGAAALLRQQHRRSRGQIEELGGTALRSEEHTSELQSRENLVCCLLLEPKNKHR